MGNKLTVYRFKPEFGDLRLSKDIPSKYYAYTFDVRGRSEKQIRDEIIEPLRKGLGGHSCSFEIDVRSQTIKVYALAESEFIIMFGHLNPKVIDISDSHPLIKVQDKVRKETPIGAVIG